MALNDTDPDFGLLDAGSETDLQDKFIPPRSSSFRTSKYPGYFSPGATIGNTPNPLAGNAPEAQLSGGEIGVPVTPPPAEGGDGDSGFRDTQPNLGGNDGSGGTSVDERASNFENVARQTGRVTNPWDAARAVALGLGLTSPTGIATTVAQTGLNLAGAPDEVTDPAGALLGHANGNPWDLKSNINLRPGYTAAYDFALNEAKRKGYTGPQAAARALDGAQETLTGGSSGWGRPGSTQPRDPSGAAPAPGAQDVTAANAVTGFAPSAPAAPAAAAPATNGGTSVAPGTPTTPTPTIGYQNAGVTAPAPAPAPAKTGGGGAGASGGGGRGVGGASGGADASHDPHAHEGGGSRGYAIGGVVQDDEDEAVPPAVSQIQHADIGDVEQEEPPVAAVPAMPPAVPSQPAHADPRYNPPAEATDPQGVVDGETAMVTPGELVIQRDSAIQYPPEVKQLLNEDPETILAALEAYGIELEDSGDDTDYESMVESAEDGVSDDNSGYGIAQGVGRIPQPAQDPRLRLSGAAR